MAKTIVVNIAYDGVLNPPSSTDLAAAYTRLGNHISGDSTLSAGRIIMHYELSAHHDKFGAESSVQISDSNKYFVDVLITFKQLLGTPSDAAITTAYNALESMIVADSVLSVGHYVISYYGTALSGSESGGDA